MLRKFTLVLALGLLFLVPLGAAAQTAPNAPQPIAYGDVIMGEIEPSESLANGQIVGDVYTFMGSAGDMVSIRMNATDDDLDTRVLIYTEADWVNNTGNALAQNDDMRDAATANERRLDSLIASIALPADGTYIIVATSFSFNEPGTYRLALSNGAVAPPPGADDAAPMPGNAEPIVQFASGATATSQFGDDNWSAQQATGEPNTFECGDIVTAWASASSTGVDTLEVTFDTAVVPLSISIFQTFTPGSITSVEVANSTTGETAIIPDSADPIGNTPCPGTFILTGLNVVFPVDTVRINVDQTIGGNWNEIDAVQLVGTPAAVDGMTTEPLAEATEEAAQTGGEMSAPAGGPLAIDDPALFEQTATLTAAIPTGGELTAEYPASWHGEVFTGEGPVVATSQQTLQNLLNDSEYRLQAGEYAVRTFILGTNDENAGGLQGIYDQIAPVIPDENTMLGEPTNVMMGTHNVIYAPVTSTPGEGNDGYAVVVDVQGNFIIMSVVSPVGTVDDALLSFMEEFIARLSVSEGDAGAGTAPGAQPTDIPLPSGTPLQPSGGDG